MRKGSFNLDMWQKSDKIFKRLCKESNIFQSKIFKSIYKFMLKNDTYIFYGRDGTSYAKYGLQYEIKFYKLQLDFAKSLIEENLLPSGDYYILFTDTLFRYNAIMTDWTEVAIASGKRKFVDFFIPIANKKIGPISYNSLKKIYSCLPMV